MLLPFLCVDFRIILFKLFDCGFMRIISIFEERKMHERLKLKIGRKDFKFPCGSYCGPYLYTKGLSLAVICLTGLSSITDYDLLVCGIQFTLTGFNLLMLSDLRHKPWAWTFELESC